MLILEFYPQFVTHSLCCDVQGLHEEEARARQSERERANRAEKKLSNRQRQMSLFHQDSAVPDIIDDEQVFPFLSFPFLSFPFLSFPLCTAVASMDFSASAATLLQAGFCVCSF